MFDVSIELLIGLFELLPVFIPLILIINLISDMLFGGR